VIAYYCVNYCRVDYIGCLLGSYYWSSCVAVVDVSGNCLNVGIRLLVDCVGKWLNFGYYFDNCCLGKLC
jgi:hypothetical protein